jgi:hypothetical protein
MTPGQNEKHYLASALNLTTGKILHCLSSRKTNALFRDLLTLLDRTYPAHQVKRLYVVVSNSNFGMQRVRGCQLTPTWFRWLSL